MNQPARIQGIIPAAGRSARFGTPKQLFKIDGKSMLISVTDALLAGGAQRAIVVLNSFLERDLSSLLPERAQIAINDDADSGMIDSIRIGLNAAGEADGYIICPCDAAGITAEDVRRCVEAFTNARDKIVVASHNGTPGHPMIFPRSLAGVVRSRECDEGLNRLARTRPQLVRLVECLSPGTVANLNTPEDFNRIT